MQQVLRLDTLGVQPDAAAAAVAVAVGVVCHVSTPPRSSWKGAPSDFVAKGKIGINEMHEAAEAAARAAEEDGSGWI